MMAIGAYRRLNEAGLVPGKDLAIITFREPPLARFLSPSLTCFRMSLRDLGVSLGESLLAAMPDFASTYPNGVVNKIWPLELVPGESDPIVAR
jgi:DNA-binding LacI/PurR family transcriptional regulator